jgi:protoporphyrinogen oxidase
LFLFLLLPTGQITPFDAHYFPENHYCFTRISEPKIYSGASRPKGITGLCVEIPCAPDDEVVQMTTEALEMRIRKELSLAGFVLPTETKAVFRFLVPDAYPVYHLGYEQTKNGYLNMVSNIKGLISFGRCGLFVHDNIHHTMAMASDAASCIEPGGQWNSSKWEECLKSFQSFVVED